MDDATHDENAAAEPLAEDAAPRARRAKPHRVEIARIMVAAVTVGDRTIDRDGIEVGSAREARELVDAAGSDERGRALLRSVPIG